MDEPTVLPVTSMSPPEPLPGVHQRRSSAAAAARGAPHPPILSRLAAARHVMAMRVPSSETMELIPLGVMCVGLSFSEPYWMEGLGSPSNR
jgi:hypothetical protein